MLRGMKLQDYLAEKKISHQDFGKLVGASEFGVRKWVRGERVPRNDAMRKIQEVTGGAVGPADFFDVPPIHSTEENLPPPAKVA